MAEERKHRVQERAHEQLPDGRVVLAPLPGDEIPLERARQLGLVGKGERIEHDPVNDPHLREGLEPLEGPEADARATGETAERAAREAAKRRK